VLPLEIVQVQMDALFTIHFWLFGFLFSSDSGILTAGLVGSSLGTTTERGRLVSGAK